jgi:hypothetical protein
MEIGRRPQAIRTHDGFCQPPHRDVIDALHWAFSYAEITIAKSSLLVKVQSAELRKKISEMENFCSELPSIRMNSTRLAIERAHGLSQRLGIHSLNAGVAVFIAL